ncbi:ADP-ribosylglycohydrolase family protein [Cellulosimicrobium funkei]|nr:ADP-ribosylglycohydrolase family protein [Cellulosimicrobium funkei]
MHFTDIQNARIAGVLTGLAAGDALGAGYEFNPPMATSEPVSMIGGGLGDFAPGEWTDDTSMAVVIARALVASGGEVTETSCGEMVREWATWAQTAPDVGSQTRAVLRCAQRRGFDAGQETPGAADALAAAKAVHERTGRSGGNGSLMRTAPVALAFLDRTPAEAYAAAEQISALTHVDPEAGEACGLWTVAIHHAVLTGKLNVRVGLPLLPADRARVWEERLRVAEAGNPRDFRNNGWVVEALQGSWSAIAGTRGDGDGSTDGPTRLRAALEGAVRGGADTDTVAAIAGSLLGAAYGVPAIPNHWFRMLHGWPGLRARDLIGLGAVLAGRSRLEGRWPAIERMDYSQWDGADGAAVVAHPDDPGVLLGPVGALATAEYDAVVSLCRVGSAEARVESAADHAEVWLVDGTNPYPEFTLQDAAETVLRFREEGKRVLLHCVRMESRTPTVAAYYGALVTGSSRLEALERMRTVLPNAAPHPAFRSLLTTQR